MSIWKRFLRWTGISGPEEPRQWWKKPSVPEQIAEERFEKPIPPARVHWCPSDPHRTACGIALMPVYKAGEVPKSTDPREVTCKNCRHTKAWKRAFEKVSD